MSRRAVIDLEVERGRQLPRAHRQILNHYLQKRRLPRGVLDGVCRDLHIDKAQSDFTLLQAAVAHLVLGGTNRQLGQADSHAEGTARGARRIRGRRVGSRPRFLFSIEWADALMSSGATTYFATVVPTFTRAVITASMSGPEMFGYFDVALGHFPADGNLVECVRPILVEHWSKLAGYEHKHWRRFCDAGLVDERTARSWADDVWSFG